MPNLFEIPLKSIAGEPTTLAPYKGHVLLIVNTASKCGLTPQYEGLEKLYNTYKHCGFDILGFPANDFAGQEPGTNQEIQKFCTLSYNVTFPMFEKVKTKGDGISPVYAFLTTGFPAPTWNFCKYLVDKNGKVLQEFPSKVKPDDKQLLDAIDAALKG